MALAEKIGVNRVLVSQWSAEESESKRDVPVDRCARIEVATGGAVTCEELRPDAKWHRVADPAWTWHPAGRPLLDVAKEAAPTPTPVET